MAPTFVTGAVVLLMAGLASADSLSHPIFKRDLVVANSSTLPGSWKSIGCYQDGNPRTLGGSSYTNGTAMTEESCVNFCNTKGYIYAGLEYSDECYCGNGFNTMVSEPITDCSMSCSGNSSEACGGPNRLNVFWNGTQPPAPPSTSPGPPGWSLFGCYAEGTSGRALTTQLTVPGGATYTSVETCTAACQAANFLYAGVEYADECYCGNSITNGAVPAPEGLSGCNMICAGNASEFCGAGNRLDVYYFGTVSSSTSSSSTTSKATTSSTSTTTSKSTTSSTSTTTSKTTTSTSTSTSKSTTSSTSTTASSTSSTTSKATTSSTSTSTSKSTTSSTSTTTSSISTATSSTSTTTSKATTSSTGTTTSKATTSSTSSTTSSTSTTTPSTSTTTSKATTSSTTTSTSSSTSPTQTGPIHVPAVGNYIWAGCYTEATGVRALNSATYVNYQTMTVEICATFCSSPVAYPMFGLEYSGECYCGYSLNAGSVSAPTTDCSMLCDGNSLEYCGAGNRLDVYTLGSSSSTSSTNTGTSTSTSTLGTISTSTSGTVSTSTTGTTSISTATKSSTSGTSTSTPTSSTSSLTSAATTSKASTSTTSTSTSSTSTSSATQTGPIHVPTVANFNWIGCYTEATQGRALNAAATVNYQTMTVEICASFCASYNFFGVEYSGECYCGNALQAGSVKAATTDCSMLCDGNSLEYCGAGNRLDVYQSNGSPPLTSTTGTGTTTGTATSTSSSSISIGSGTTGLPAGWKYDGCYVDNMYGRILAYEQNDNQQLTVESCVNTCAGLGYSVAGMEYGIQCFCDNYLANGAALATTQADCSTPCGGNANEKCGNGNRMSVYNIGTLVTYAVPTEQTGGIPGWTYSGCRSDNEPNGTDVNGNVIQVRTLFWQIILPQNNTATNCLGLCHQFGYNAGGMEYGDECYCGDIAYVAAGLSSLKPETDCGTTCSGNVSELCGGGNRLSYYTWTGTPLYTWHTPSGGAMGEYSFLIGGVVVPLITAPAVNGKVTFVEKFGTSENASSTGAYELDLAEIDNFALAWRTMHVKTDVFCSASLTLPDKVGRQINVGGWAEESVFGIRLYWPDGSPGVPGVNDWQENYNEVALQVARWYPTAMIMTNGSILVMGGEIGSNSAPSPSLEILPPTGGGTVFLDFLNRTNPYNLYPFLAVLPSGGIFVAYWNEARILDEVTFATTRTLPNIPGTVNNFEAGRTYPLEGTAMLLPQYAPYSDPLGILICGGSTAGAGLAIDNCVSTTPEIAGAPWVIERMPSQRVMSCICALPDGTYLILNGAHQGQAGFGLATSPNLGAILYDPSQPVNSRMSIMATTIVARLYHSEASLLQDGRVLVSGSDPQDGVHPEEYRVEVFLPPYLLNGAQAPTLTVANKDWSYGQQITVTINLPSGNAGNAKFSLMGAAASTHGNSMGQRTLFPAFSCASATSCTITAPPNTHVAPAGWFQLFVLDGPTPGTSTWVRIGGDPAGLGNWPNFPDFNTPGI